MKLKYISILYITLVAIASCTKSDDMTQGSEPRMDASVVAYVPDSSTRMGYEENSEGKVVFSWEANDSFGLYEGGGSAEATLFTTTDGGSTFEGSYSTSIADGTLLYATYPALSGAQNPKSILHSIAEQSFVDGALEVDSKSNFIIAKSEYTNDAVPIFAFEHRMSMVKLNLVLPSDVEAASIARIRFGATSIVTSAKIDITAESPAWTAATEGYIDLNVTNLTATDGVAEVWLMLFPQELINLNVQLLDSSDKLLADTFVRGDVELVAGKWYENDVLFEGDAFDSTLGGSSDNPIVIATAKDLCDLSAYYNSGAVTSDRYIMLANDIDMMGLKFSPINTFRGHIDGNDCRIDNILIEEENLIYAGFFKTFQSGSIKNITIGGDMNLTYSGTTSKEAVMIGGIFGQVEDKESVYFSGSVTSEMEINVNSVPANNNVLNIGGVGGVVKYAETKVTGDEVGDDGELVESILKTGLFFMSGAIVTYGSADVDVEMNVIGGKNTANIGGIFGSYIAAGATQATMNVYAEEIKYSTSTGAVNAYLGGIYGTFKPGNNLGSSTFNLTSDLTMEYTGDANDARNLMCGTLAGIHGAKQTNKGNVKSSNITVKATSTSSAGVLAVTRGIAFNSQFGGILGYNDNNQNANHLLGTDTDVSYVAEGGEARVILQVTQE